MHTKDYYSELGVASDADEKTIKQAYRKLARQYHPDVNTDDKQAEEQFKAINEAYHVLSDPEKRQRYDTMRHQQRYWQHAGTSADADRGWWQDAAGGRVYTNTVSPEDISDMFGNSDFFSSIFGSAFSTQPGGAARPRRGRDVEVPVEMTLQEALHGTRRTVQADDKRIEAHIPPGVQNGSRVRLSGQGHAGQAGGSAGDLYLVVHILPDVQFEREGDNLTTEVPVDIYTAATGGEVRVATLDGSVMLKIPAQTQAGKRFRLRGRGMPRLEQPEHRGDLYVRVKLVLPESLDADELATLHELAQRRKTEKQPA
jgi:curved DNA-binding protein